MAQWEWAPQPEPELMLDYSGAYDSGLSPEWTAFDEQQQQMGQPDSGAGFFGPQYELPEIVSEPYQTDHGVSAPTSFNELDPAWYAFEEQQQQIGQPDRFALPQPPMNRAQRALQQQFAQTPPAEGWEQAPEEIPDWLRWLSESSPALLGARGIAGDVAQFAGDSLLPNLGFVPGMPTGLPFIGGLAQGLNALGGPSLGDIGRFGVETAFPTTPLELGTEFLPGVGFGGDIARAGRRAIDATTPLLGRAAADLAAGPLYPLREWAQQGELGAARIPGGKTPDGIPPGATPEPPATPPASVQTGSGAPPNDPGNLPPAGPPRPDPAQSADDPFRGIDQTVGEARAASQTSIQQARTEAAALKRKALLAGATPDEAEELTELQRLMQQAAEMIKADPVAARAAFRANAEAAGQAAEAQAKASSEYFANAARTRKAAAAADVGDDVDVVQAQVGVLRSETAAAVQRTADDLVTAASGGKGSGDKIAVTALESGDKGGGFGITDELTALVGMPRTLKASFDLSAPGRQGLALAFRHPIEWAQGWVPMLRAWKSAENMAVINDEIAGMLKKWTDEFGVSPNLYDTGSAAASLSRVPGFEPIGKGYLAKALRKVPGLEQSERAYATFLNYQKAKTFNTMARSLQRAGEANKKVYQDLANIIDHATGWGAAPLKGRFEGQALFSQRYTTSRFQFLVDPLVEGLMKGDLRTARAATENLIAFAGGMAGLLYLINETGMADVTLDPRSSDFGKIRIGPLRIDLGAGFLPLIRTAARLATGEAKSATGSVYDVKSSHLEALKFFRNKLAPVPSEIVSRLAGETAIGEPPPKILSTATLRQLFMPLIADAVMETLQETGNARLAALVAAAEMFGAGTSTYGSGQVRQIEAAKQQYGKEYDSLYSAQQAQINREIVDGGVDLPYRDRSGPWWAARDDAFAYWKAQVSAEDRADPIIQHILAEADYSGLFPGPDEDGRLAKWIANTYRISRAEAVSAASKSQNETGLTDAVQAYREDVLSADPGFLEAWIEAYEAGETDFGPPKWARDFVQEGAGVR